MIEDEAPPRRNIARRRAAVARATPASGAGLPRPVAIAACLTLAVAAGARWSSSPLEALERGTTAASAGSSLHLPAAYTILSPLCEAYDALTLLTLEQHAALLGWLVAVFAVIRAARWIRRRREAVAIARERWRAIRREIVRFVALVAGFVAVYVAGAIVPRPMAALMLSDRDELAVDVHSHTSVSHDGRPGFDAEANRRWHAAAGFAAAYITDHRFYDGAVAGARGNPRTAGEGTVLLPGIESAAPHSRLTLLGARAPMGLDENGHFVTARLAAVPDVVVVLTTPTALAQIPATLPLGAVEASDGAPRGLMFTRRMAPDIARFTAARGLVAVAGSNNHGWGRTATAWTVLRIPGWRALSPDALDRAIRTTLLHSPGAVRVVARGSVALPRSAGGLIATPLLVAWSIVTRLSTAERAAWLLWGWAGALLALVLTRSAAGDDEVHVLPLRRALPNDDSRAGRAARRAGRGGRN